MLVVVILIGVYLVGNLTGAAVSVLPNPTVTKTFGTPDLIVSDISWTWQQNQLGYNIMVTIKNQGTAKASNFEVMVKDTTNNVELFPPVAANQKQARCKLTIDAGQTGVCTYTNFAPAMSTLPATIRATADSPQNLFGGGMWQTGIVKESNENNNVLSIKFLGCDFTTIGKCPNGICEKEKVQRNGCPDRSETKDNCMPDCGKCGDGSCHDIEKIFNGYVDPSSGTVYKWACKADCGYVWGDGTCDKGEAGTAGAFLDCGKCGDGKCDSNEFKDEASMKADVNCKANPKLCKICAADC
jgi:hypothetical protein